MAGIARLNIVKDTAGTSYGSGNLLYTAGGNFLLSVIVSSASEDDGTFSIYVVPEGEEETPSSWGNIVYNLPLPSFNSYETFRFGVNNGDSVYSAGSANFDYYVQGILQ